jgi:hypothetical protein
LQSWYTHNNQYLLFKHNSCCGQAHPALKVLLLAAAYLLTFCWMQPCLQTKPSGEQKQQQHLPQEVLKLVLQRIEQEERLHCCSLVCKASRAAAAATITSIYTALQPTISRSLQLWLSTHGGNVKHLSLRSDVDIDRQQLSLPFAQLTQLRSCTLSGCVVQPVKARPFYLLSAKERSQRLGSSSSNVLSCLSSLTMLEMSNVTLRGFVGGIQSLTALTALQDLTIGEGFCTEAARTHGWSVFDEEDTELDQLCLRQLTQLTRLVLPPEEVWEERAPFRALRQLQHLEVTDSLCHESAARLLAQLPASLTHLDFRWRSTQEVSDVTLPSLASLTALRSLSVWDWGADSSSSSSHTSGGLQPVLLSNMLQLQQLRIGQLSSDALPALLQVLSQLSSLQHLDLGCAGVQPLAPSEAAR